MSAFQAVERATKPSSSLARIARRRAGGACCSSASCWSSPAPASASWPSLRELTECTGVATRTSRPPLLSNSTAGWRSASGGEVRDAHLPRLRTVAGDALHALQSRNAPVDVSRCMTVARQAERLRLGERHADGSVELGRQVCGMASAAACSCSDQHGH